MQQEILRKETETKATRKKTHNKQIKQKGKRTPFHPSPPQRNDTKCSSKIKSTKHANETYLKKQQQLPFTQRKSGAHIHLYDVHAIGTGVEGKMNEERVVFSVHSFGLTLIH